MMEAVCSSEISVSLRKITQHNIWEESTL
jgi:hypothetical protein